MKDQLGLARHHDWSSLRQNFDQPGRPKISKSVGYCCILDEGASELLNIERVFA
jgi:hypothetical protein